MWKQYLLCISDGAFRSLSSHASSLSSDQRPFFACNFFPNQSPSHNPSAHARASLSPSPFSSSVTLSCWRARFDNSATNPSHNRPVGFYGLRHTFPTSPVSIFVAYYRRHLNHSEAILRFFVQLGRHVAPMGMKFRRSTHPRQMSPHRCRDVRGTPKTENCIQFWNINVPHVRIRCEICTKFSEFVVRSMIG